MKHQNLVNSGHSTLYQTLVLLKGEGNFLKVFLILFRIEKHSKLEIVLFKFLKKLF